MSAWFPVRIEARLNWTLPDDFAGFPPRRASPATKVRSGIWQLSRAVSAFTARRFWPRAAAQRAQPGLITLFTQETVYHAVAAQLQAVMVNIVEAGNQIAGIDQRHFDRPRPGRAGNDRSR